MLDQIKRLAAPPTNARSFLVADSYGRGSHEVAGDAFKKKVFNGLAELHYGPPFLQIGYVGELNQGYGVHYLGLSLCFQDFGYIWDAVLNTAPGYAAFGYNSPGACTRNSSSLAGVVGAG